MAKLSDSILYGFSLASDSKDRSELSDWSERDGRSECRDRRRRLHQADDTAQGRHRQVALVAQLLHHRLELRRRQMGESLHLCSSAQSIGVTAVTEAAQHGHVHAAT